MKYKVHKNSCCFTINNINNQILIIHPIRHENGQLKNVDRAVVKIANSKLPCNQAPIIRNVMYLKTK